jgi:L-asparaginase / beta-aspartyl-peptidase
MSSKNSKYSIVLHAGAAESWHGNAESHRNSVVFLEALVEKAKSDLRNGAIAVDVVTEITAALEDFPDFNAGKGSALNQEGFHEVM